ncbi:hypothetical protein GCM10023093_20550 [Nemorincola caseinilytica]|uniref:Cytochrome c domain-containing protein n=1 Tax=Nemorincola caseinilytica TaxID=2054315 RepID=A0ABP8NFE9_9BACT
MRNTTIKAFLAIAGTILFLAPASAADGDTAAKAVNINTTFYTLVSLMIILLFIIGVLAYTLRQVTAVVREKNRKTKQGKAGILAILLLVATLPASAQMADTSKAYHFPELIDGIPFADFCLLVAVIVLELLVIFFLATYVQTLLRALKGQGADVTRAVAEPKVSFWDRFNKAKALEEEKEILLDHNYDGIMELDNSLPPWWKYGFYLTILVSVIYIYRFHFSHDGLSQEEEFVAEMQKGEEEKAAYLARSANNVDETNVKYLTDAGSLVAGREVFVKNCAACHVADGGGSVGPNLADEYWLHGGSVQDVFKSVKYGWQDKGMKSWKDDLSPMQIQQVASFIMSLKGTHPAAPKAPQGDIYIEVAKADSAVAAK